MGSYKFFTKEEIRNICEMYNDGMPYRMIAEKTGRAASTIAAKIVQCRKQGLITRHRYSYFDKKYAEYKNIPADWNKFNPGMCAVRK